MRAPWFVAALVSGSLFAGSITADEILTSVTTDTWGVMSQGKMAYRDYHYATTTLFWAEVSLIDLATKAKTVLLPSGTVYPYYIDYGFSNNHLAYILKQTGGSGGGGGGSMGGRTSYLDYKQLPSGTPRRLIADDSWKEMVWVGGDMATWVDYRNWDSTTVDSTNSEIYLCNIVTGTETRLTSDHAYQEKPFTDGQRVVWVDYSAGYGKVFMRTISSGTTQEVAPYPAGKDNPRVSGSYVIWEDYRNTASDPKNGDIYLYNIASNSTTPVCVAAKHQGNPYVSGNMIIWEDYRNAATDSTNADIYAYNISSGVESEVVRAAGYQGHPTLNNDTLCWFNMTGSTMSLMLRDIKALTAIAKPMLSAGPAIKPAVRMLPGGILRLEGVTGHDVMVRITDISGRCVFRQTVGTDASRGLKIPAARGTYSVTVSSADHMMINRKITIQ